MSRSDDVAALVDALEARAAADVVTLEPDVARRLLGVAARLYAVAAEEAAEEGEAMVTAEDVTPTEAVVVATAVLRAHELTPFDLAVWFPRSAP